MWCIPAPANAAFVCQMETVLAVYRRTSDPAYPVVRMDETSVQCVRETRDPILSKPGQSERYDVEYERKGVTHLLAFYAPFENWRRIDIADNHAAEQWAQGIRRLVQEDYPQATRITLRHGQSEHPWRRLPILSVPTARSPLAVGQISMRLHPQA